MNAFMYYIRRIDLLERSASIEYTDFIEYAVNELLLDISTAAGEEYLTEYQSNKLYERIYRLI